VSSLGIPVLSGAWPHDNRDVVWFLVTWGVDTPIFSLSFSLQNPLLRSVDETIKFWNPADGSLVKSIDQAHTSRSARSVSYSPNGRILVSAGWNDKTMKIWNAETFELRHKFEQKFNTNQLTIRNL
jgi:WD40 repeat protein